MGKITVGTSLSFFSLVALLSNERPGGGFLPLWGALTKQRGLARLEFVSFWPIRTGDFMSRLGN
jgi:hypothetical protein